jgi:ribosomal protein S18 acetylase RimI-like enzyme
MITWQVVENAGEEEFSIISNGVTEYGRSLAIGGDARPIACFAYDQGKLIAGATGRTEFSRLFVSYLWASEEFRNQGLGTKALMCLEAEAIKRGCRDAIIETLSDRVAVLYRRLGYVTLASIPNYVGHFNRHILLKQLCLDKYSDSKRSVDTEIGKDTEHTEKNKS